MSLPEYSACLRPDPGLRRIVVAGALLLIGGGCGAVAVLPLSPGSRAVLALIWICSGSVELVYTLLGFRRCLSMRIHAGGATTVYDRDTGIRVAELAPGSLVTARFAWLRLRAADGTRYTEPVSGSCRQSEEWRRLQVIWRHIGASG